MTSPTVPCAAPTGKLEPHPLADLFPLFGEDDLAALSQDIFAHGLKHPIVLYDGKVLDGRNRLAACEKVGVAPRFETFTGDDEEALDHVLSLNMRRRDMTLSQRAMIAADLADTDRGRLWRSYSAKWQNKITSKLAAKKTGATLRTVGRARRILEHGAPELDAIVRSPDAGVKITDAESICKLPHDTQREVIKKFKAGDYGSLRSVWQEMKDIMRGAKSGAGESAIAAGG